MSQKKYDVVERTDGLGTTTWIRWNDARTSLKLQELINKKCDILKEFTDYPHQVARAMMLDLVEESEK